MLSKFCDIVSRNVKTYGNKEKNPFVLKNLNIIFDFIDFLTFEKRKILNIFSFRCHQNMFMNKFKNFF